MAPHAATKGLSGATIAAEPGGRDLLLAWRLGASLFGREDLAADAHVSADGSGFAGIALAHNVGSPEEVDAVLA